MEDVDPGICIPPEEVTPSCVRTLDGGGRRTKVRTVTAAVALGYTLAGRKRSNGYARRYYGNSLKMEAMLVLSNNYWLP